MEIKYKGLDIEADYHKGSKGSIRDGLKVEPDEPDEIEIIEVYCDGNDITDIISIDKLAEICMEQLSVSACIY